MFFLVFFRGGQNLLLKAFSFSCILMNGLNCQFSLHVPFGYSFHNNVIHVFILCMETLHARKFETCCQRECNAEDKWDLLTASFVHAKSYSYFLGSLSEAPLLISIKISQRKHGDCKTCPTTTVKLTVNIPHSVIARFTCVSCKILSQHIQPVVTLAYIKGERRKYVCFF